VNESLLSNQRLSEIIDLLEENYYVLNSTGTEAIETMRSDLDMGHFNNGTNTEWGTINDDIETAIRHLEIQFLREDKSHTPAVFWYVQKDLKNGR